MKSIRLTIVFFVLAVSLLLMGGCSRHYVDVYVNNQCYLVNLDNDTAIESLLVFKGDYVIFNNLGDNEVELNLPDGVFERDKVTISPGKRVILKVIMNGPHSKNMNIECTGGSGSPKVVVGEEP